MRIELPEFRRCCFCFPLRRGVLVYGYICLLFTLFCLWLEIYLGYDDLTGMTLVAYHGNSFFTRAWLAILLYVIDFVFTIIMLVGAHTKRVRLLTIYFYYGVTTTLATFLTMFIINYDLLNRDLYNVIIEITFIVFAIILHLYMLCLVWNMIKRLKQNSGLTFVNQVTEVVIEPPAENIQNPL
ncbi:uncharacterized protein LOC110991704 [Pieris rapae]|uniref:uncharacterized protein LOC110991704 n=1 Tax=Pieris rapae TaxID=64459 RepID=UPI001E27B7CE|nr:uncharacterized protein LOC110991704 [Pieris rapae]